MQHKNQFASTIVKDKELHCQRMEQFIAERDDVLRYLTGESRARGLAAIHREVEALRRSYETIERVERRLCGLVKAPARKVPVKGLESR